VVRLPDCVWAVRLPDCVWVVRLPDCVRVVFGLDMFFAALQRIPVLHPHSVAMMMMMMIKHR